MFQTALKPYARKFRSKKWAKTRVAGSGIFRTEENVMDISFSSGAREAGLLLESEPYLPCQFIGVEEKLLRPLGGKRLSHECCPEQAMKPP
ncbi:hypothetical protein [Rhodanobacter sp. T12-5]|uniref:hypothetical protein n=1 Tax=Rhodanobacter sp. T12-5 TaxID=2024611 RepID=UPI001561E4FA|nr:hypothetical protein [Rhodanobacter sp. T12-5]